MTTQRPTKRDINQAVGIVSPFEVLWNDTGCRSAEDAAVNAIAQALAQREAEVRAEYAALTTADGVHGSPTMDWFHPNHSLPGVLRCDYCDGYRVQFEVVAAGKPNGYFASYRPSECYATRENADAALAARKEGE
jgi:hypothetical protein